MTMCSSRTRSIGDVAVPGGVRGTSRFLTLALAVVILSGRAETWLTDDALTFSNLTASIDYVLPEGGLRIRQITSYGNATAVIRGTSLDDRLTLTGGADEENAAINNRPTSSYGSGFHFRVPVDLDAADEQGGVRCLYAGGSSFFRPVTLTRSTAPLSILRERLSSVNFRGTSCVSDLSRAARLTLGRPGRTSNGVSLAAIEGGRVTLPAVTLACGSSIEVTGTGSRVEVKGDVEMTDAMYTSSGNSVHTRVEIADGGTLSCARLVQTATTGPTATLSVGGTLEATVGIALHATSGAALTVAGGMVRTPDFNLNGTVAAVVTGAATFDTAALTTRVGAVTFAPSAALSATGGGAISFTRATEIPELALAADTTLLFDQVGPDQPLLTLGKLTLPAAGRAKIRVTNRMLSGTVTLATGVTSGQLAAMTVEIPSCATLRADDGRLVFAIEGVDLTQPATAVWTDGGRRGDVSDPENWLCRDANGAILPGALPTFATAVRIDGDCSFSTASGGPAGSLTIEGKLTLSADCAWDAAAFDAVTPGTLVDLNGHVLSLAGFDGRFGRGLMLADFAGTGELRVAVAAGATFVLEETLLRGRLRLVKSGEGDLALVRADGEFARGEQVGGGRVLHLPGFVPYEEFGARGDGKTDDLAAIVAAHACANRLGLPVRARDDAVYYVGRDCSTAEVETDTDFGSAQFVIDDTVVQYNTPVFRIQSRQAAFPVAGIPPLRRGQRNIGVTLPCRCVVRIEDDRIERFIRSGDPVTYGEPQHEMIVVDADGNVDPRGPICWDYDEVTSATAYPVDDDVLTVKGGRFTTIANPDGTTRYYQRGLLVARSNTRVEGVWHAVVEPEPPAVASLYTGMFAVQDCAYVTISNCTLSARRNKNGGSYDTDPNGVVGLTYVDCRQANDIHDDGNWGVMGSNYCKDMLVERCSFSRVDAHQGVCGLTVRDSELGAEGISVVGFGMLLLENTTFTSRNMVYLRYDYGSFWDGEMVIRNCRFVPTYKDEVAAIRISNGENTDFGSDCMMPWRVTVDGLTIDDSKVGKSSSAPYLFTGINARHTGPEYVPAIPYRMGERVVTRGVTVASGRPLGLSPNGWMFRTVDAEEEPDGIRDDFAFSYAGQTPGWNWTNGTFAVDVTHVDAPIRDGRLVLTVTDASGRIVCEREQAVTEPGRVTFGYDLPRAGSRYVGTVTARDGTRPLFFSPTVSFPLSSGSADEGGVTFAADVVGGVPRTLGGAWRATPKTAADAYRISKDADFVLDGKPASPVSVVTMRVRVADALDPATAEIPPDAIGFAAFGTDASCRWQAVRPTADGPRWFRLAGAEPQIGSEYDVRFEIDRGPDVPRVRYAVREASGTDFTVLTDVNGADWQKTSLPANWNMSEIGFRGCWELARLAGRESDCAVAEADGVRYGDLNAALSAASEKGTTVTLLVDLVFEPDGASGEVSLDVAGKRLVWREGDGCTLVGDAATGRFRLVPTSGGTLANGLTGYESYVLGIDTAETRPQPVLDLAREEDGSLTLALQVNPPAGTGATIRYRLEESPTPDFGTLAGTRESSSPVFRLAPPVEQTRFYRMKVEIAAPDGKR